MALFPALEGRVRWISELEARLDYRVMGRTTQRNTVIKSPQHTHTQPSKVAHTCNPSSGEAEMERYLEFTGYPAYLVSSRAVGDSLSKRWLANNTT